MAKKFRKEILREDKYVTGDGAGGRQVTDVTSDRIEHWAKTLNAMNKAGLLIPAPELHDAEESPSKYEGEKVAAEGSKSNYGFWSDFTVIDVVNEDGETIKALEGVLDVPLEADAELIGNTVKETSIYSMNKFVDGKGNVWDDAIIHIAPVIKAIEPGQKNFQPVEGDMSIAMSHSHRLSNVVMRSMGSNTKSVNTEDLTAMLEEVAGISLPENTPDEKLRECLLLLLKQKHLSEKNNRNGGSVSSPPDDSFVNEVPVVMSTNQTQKTPTVDVTPEPTVETPAVDPVVMSQHQGMLSYVTEQTKGTLSRRLKALHQRNTIGDDQLKELSDEVSSVVMSFEDGQPQKPAVEKVIEHLEKIKVPMPANKPVIAMSHTDDDGNYVIQQNNVPEGDGSMTPARVNSVLDNLFGQTNR